jgi:hypothetical protein
VGSFKKHNPGCPCCGAACADLCFHVTGCGSDIASATIDVFVTGSPGTIIATGTTDANGEKCFTLSAYSGSSLSYTVTPPGTGFDPKTAVLVGNWCGRTVSVLLTPGTIAGTPSESGGTVNVLLTRCDGTTPWSGQLVEIKVSLSVITSGYTDANGRVTLTITADGSSAYYIRSYTTAPASQLNSATFILSAGECADAHMRMTNNMLILCNPDTEEVITERTCGGGTPDVRKTCCSYCAPETLASVLSLADPQAHLGSCVFGSTEVEMTGWFTYDDTIWRGFTSTGIYYTLTCSPTGFTLHKSSGWGVLRCGVSVPTPPFGSYTCVLCETGTGNEAGYSETVSSASATCDPLAMTFNMPAKTWTYYKQNPSTGAIDTSVSCGTVTMNAHTISVAFP